MRLLFSSLILIVLVTLSADAQSLVAQVSNNKIGLTDQFQLSFTYSGSDANSISKLNTPDFNNFVILSGPNLSTSMQIINGVVSSSRTYTYYLQAKTTGKFTIGSASVNIGSKTFKSDPINIEVVPGTSKPKQQDNGSSDVNTKEIADNVFIRAFADKQKVFIGEQVTVTYKLYTRVNIASQMSISKLPSYQGFWSEEIETPNNIDFTTEVLDGKQFRVGILKRAALFPNQTGDLSVSPFELVIPLQLQRKKRSNDPFDDFFNDPFFGRTQSYDYTAKSNTINVQVMPLPEQNKPASFKGAVGDYSLNSSADKLDTKTNEPVTLKLEISGTGNIKLLEAPELNLPSGFDKYDPKTSEQVNRSLKISGKKTIEYLLIPRTVGKKEVPPVEFSYFDPGKKTYVTLKTPSYTINIEQGTITYSQGYSGKEDIRLLGDDIRFIKTSTALQKPSVTDYLSARILGGAALPLFAFAGLIVWKKRSDKLQGDQGRYKYVRARKGALARLKNS